MHTYLQDGVFTIEVWLFLTACQHVIDIEKLREYLEQPWQFPAFLQAKGKLLYRVFSDYRLDSDGNLDKLRASASELLGLYTLLRHLFTMRLQHRAGLKANWDSFDACCQVLDIIHACKKTVSYTHLTLPTKQAV